MLVPYVKIVNTIGVIEKGCRIIEVVEASSFKIIKNFYVPRRYF